MAEVKAFLATLTVGRVLPSLLILVAGAFIIKGITKVFDKLIARSKLNKSFHAFIKAALKILLWVLLILIAASSLGIDVTSLIAVLSVASLAVSLAVQDSLANVAGGIMVLTSHPFEVGHYVSLGGVEGTVTEVGLVHTTLTTPDNKIIYVPNSEAASSKIVNYTKEGKRRVDLTFTASYDSHPDTVKQALTEAASLPCLLEGEPMFVKITEYKESDIAYTVRVWVATADYWDAYFTILENVKKSFDAHGVVMTYPHTIVHLEK